MYYYAIDGDDVGRRLEALVLSNDLVAVRAYSRIVETAINLIRDRSPKSLLYMMPAGRM